MATDKSISLVSGTTSFNIDADKVIYAKNDANSKAVLIYEKDNGVPSTPLTLTISVSALVALSTNILFSATVIPDSGINTAMCFNKYNVIKITSFGGQTKMEYDQKGVRNYTYTITGSTSTLSTAAKITIPVTDNLTGDTYYINGLNAGIVSQKPSSTGNLTLNSAVLVNPGTLWIPTETFDFSGGTHIDIAHGKVNTTEVVSGVVTAAGMGADPSLTLHVAGGTGTAAQLSFSSKVVSITGTPVAAGASYNVGDTVNPNGGTGTKPVFTVTHIQGVSAPAVGGAGSGYVTGDHVSPTTGTGTKPVYSVTASAGAVTGLTLLTPGDLTVRSTLGATVATTAVTGIGTGLTINLVAADFGALTVTNTTPGSLTVNPTAITASATTAVTGTGTGMTVTFVMGVNAIIAAVNPGNYTVNPTLTDNAVTTGATGATVTIVMGINTFTITDGGSYSVATSNPVSETNASGSGTGATFTASFTGSVTEILYDAKKNVPQHLLVDETPVEISTLINALIP